MRTQEEIRTEIAKVEKAKTEAVKKQARCYKRLKELREELKKTSTVGAVDAE